MSGTRIGAIVCFVLAVAFLISGINSIMKGPSVGDASGLGVSHAVGALLPCIVTLILGVWLFGKSSK